MIIESHTIHSKHSHNVISYYHVCTETQLADNAILSLFFVNKILNSFGLWFKLWFKLAILGFRANLEHPR